MTLNQLYLWCSEELAFTECGEFESLCLINDIIGYTKEQIYFNTVNPSDSDIQKIKQVVERRKAGEPLQYILGKWDFFDQTFYVGEGVLIPRPETEMLVDFALDKLKSIDNPVVFDLCVGSGCIGLTIAKHRKDAVVYLLEKEEKAFNYLKRNAEALNLQNVKLINGDLFFIDLSVFPQADLILSNPPYIETDIIGDLQKEVLFEPRSALDGGFDGLDFYRCLSEKWSSKVKKDGFMAFECGEEQSQPIISIFSNKCTENKVIFDFNNIDRVVTFRI